MEYDEEKLRHYLINHLPLLRMKGFNMINVDQFWLFEKDDVIYDLSAAEISDENLDYIVRNKLFIKED